MENLTHVQINHYARIDFNHVANVVNVMGGVDVTLPDITRRASGMSSTSGSITSTA